MSHILKIALCPAPFQKPKKKGKGLLGSHGRRHDNRFFAGEKKKDKKLAHSPGSPFQEMLPNGLVVDTTTRSHSTSGRPSSISPRSSMSSGSPQQALRSAYSHQSDMMRAVVVPHCSNCSSSPSGPPCCRQVPAPPPYTTSYGSGYQSEYGGPSGYSGGLETQMLARATKDRPANLRMTAIRDYSPGCNEELSVRKGQRVRVLYRNHDWVFAVTKHGSSGFIPFTYVRPSRKYNGYQSEPEIARVDESYVSGYDTDATSFPFPPQQPLRQLPRTTRQPASSPQAYTINTSCRRVGSGSPVQAHVDRVFDSGYMSAVEGYYQPQTRSTPSSRYRPTTHKPSMDSFDKEFIEELVVIHDFEAKEEDEVLVRKGERVKVLNATDPNWLWVRLIGGMGEEGFIPRSCCTLGNHPCKFCYNLLLLLLSLYVLP